MYTIGIDLGGTNIAAGLVNEKYEIVFRASVPTNKDGEYDKMVESMAGLVKTLTEQAGITLDEVKYIGIGAPGVLDNENGVATDNSNIHWNNYPLRAKLQKYVDKPVYLGNDANVAAWAEYIGGCGRGAKNFLMLTLGTGVGGGIILDGKLHTGSHNIGAEIGHTTFKAGGRKCGCGNYGCIESYCSATALIKMAEEAVADHPESLIAKAEKIDAKCVIDAAKAGDKFGCELFNEYVSNLSQVIASIVNFLDPDVIALGGGVANAGEFLLEPVRKEFPQYVTFSSMQNTRVLKAEMGNDAGIIGAAVLGE